MVKYDNFVKVIDGSLVRTRLRLLQSAVALSPWRSRFDVARSSYGGHSVSQDRAKDALRNVIY